MQTRQTTPENVTYAAKLEQLRNDIAAVMPSIVADPQAAALDLTDEHQALITHAKGLEGVFLTIQLGLLLLRGASATEIERHTASGHQELPFQGAEQALYDALMSHHAVQLGSRESVTEAIASILGYLENMMSLVEKHVGYPRTELYKMLCGEIRK